MIFNASYRRKLSNSSMPLGATERQRWLSFFVGERDSVVPITDYTSVQLTTHWLTVSCRLPSPEVRCLFLAATKAKAKFPLGPLCHVTTRHDFFLCQNAWTIDSVSCRDVTRHAKWNLGLNRLRRLFISISEICNSRLFDAVPTSVCLCRANVCFSVTRKNFKPSFS